jgi:hypothetical protein
MTDWLQLCDDIDDGDFDDGLEDIARAVQFRRELVHRKQARRLQRDMSVGDRVILTNKITPRYLEGCSATVTKIQEGAAVVELDELPIHRGRPTKEKPTKKLLVPFIHLVKLDADVETLRNTDDAADIGDDEEYEDDDD